jgi:hypothetical protein
VFVVALIICAACPLGKLAELAPKNVIDEAPRRPDHDGVAPLPMKTIGAQPVTPA